MHAHEVHAYEIRVREMHVRGMHACICKMHVYEVYTAVGPHLGATCLGDGLEIFGGAEWRVCRGTEGQMSKLPTAKHGNYIVMMAWCYSTNFIWLGIIEYIVSYPNYVSSIVPPWKVLYRDRQPFQSR